MMLTTIASFILLGAASTAVAADVDDLEFSLEGYYRTRGYVFRNLTEDQEAPARAMVQRLRLEPQVNFDDRAKFFFQTDVLDDVMWGDNASLASTALFAGNPSATGMDGNEADTFQVKRAWMEFDVPVGQLRVGRQPSNWGMGLLANDGNGFDDTFGENHRGSTYDRIIFATKPIAIAQTILGRPDSGTPLYFAVGVDRLVEDPLIEYYGYTCTDGLVAGVDEDYDQRCDTDCDGITDVEHDFTDEDRTADQRNDDWWLDQEDDVMEMIYVLIYKGQGLSLGGSAADLTAGVYVVNRTQVESNSDILISDAYLKFLWKGIYAEGEVLNIRGQTDAIVLPGAYDPSSANAPLYKEANIWGYVGRLGMQNELMTAMFETGYASGDENVADVDFTGRAIHSDFNVGLLMYEEILARVTSTVWTENAEGLWSNGGVVNSRYIFPNIRYRPIKNWEFVAAYLRAWPHLPDGSRILCADYDEKDGEPLNCAENKATAKHIGWETDFAVKHRFHEHVLFSMEAGYASMTDRVPLENVGLNPDGKFFTFQSRIAYEF